MKYLHGYSEEIKRQVDILIGQNRLSDVLLQKYSEVHDIRTDKALYAYLSWFCVSCIVGNRAYNAT